MKCAACGYEYSRRWNVETGACDDSGDEEFREVMLRDRGGTFPVFYICPKCGTVRAE